MLQRQTTSASEASNEASRSAFEKKFPGVITPRPVVRDFRSGAGATPFAASPLLAVRNAPPARRIAIVSVRPPVAHRAGAIARASSPADAVTVLTPRELGVLSAFANAIKKNARG